jgi:hypothetical protein
MNPKSSPADDRIIEVSDLERGAPPRVLLALLVGCAAGAVFGSGPLRDAAGALPESPIVSRIQTAAARWDDVMADIGATLPYARLRAGVRFFEAWNAPS